MCHYHHQYPFPPLEWYLASPVRDGPGLALNLGSACFKHSSFHHIGKTNNRRQVCWPGYEFTYLRVDHRLPSTGLGCCPLTYKKAVMFTMVTSTIARLHNYPQSSPKEWRDRCGTRTRESSAQSQRGMKFCSLQENGWNLRVLIHESQTYRNKYYRFFFYA